MEEYTLKLVADGHHTTHIQITAGDLELLQLILHITFTAQQGCILEEELMEQYSTTPTTLHTTQTLQALALH